MKPILAILRAQLRPRRTSVVFIALLFFALVFGLSRIVAFAHLFGVFGGHSGTRISQPEVAIQHNSTTPDPRTPVVPKILHQIFHNWKDAHDMTPPAHWADARQTCVRFNPDWEFRLWGLVESRNFIKEFYPWFLATYDSYKYPIQRIDVLRYFILRKYGGIYLDLDNGCSESIIPLTYLPAFTTDGDKGTLSNNIMGGQPDHPYWHLLTNNLISYKWNWILPYVMISYQSGQWYVTAMWEKYHSLLAPDGTVAGFPGNGYKPLHHVLMDGDPGADPWIFFTQTDGGTWTNWDSYIFHLIGDYIIFVILGAVVGIGMLGWSFIACVKRRKSSGYQPVSRSDMGEVTL